MRAERWVAGVVAAVIGFVMVTVVAFAGAEEDNCTSTPAPAGMAGLLPAGALGDVQVANLARMAGWPEELLGEVVATSWAESSHNSSVANGLMQIGPADAARYGMAGANVADPLVNLSIARRIYTQTGGWAAYWGTWPGPGRPVPQNNKVREKLTELSAGGWLVADPSAVDQPSEDGGRRCAKAPDPVAATNGLNPEFLRRFQAYNAQCWGGALKITDGFRSRDQQADLFRRKPNLAAPPGRSNHELGLAIDHDKSEQGTEAHRQCAIQNHLFYPMWPGCSSKVEKWHIEPIELRKGRC
ncbi:MAG: M15 family metallopeptidase [Actinomycetota bacterium]|nr:M15 family metallopeptidase [Actinomycetota bacterium]